MNCSEAREAMLELDLSELRGDGDSPLTAHVRTCKACQDRAMSIVFQTARVGGLIATRRRSNRWSMRRIALVASLPIAAVVVIGFHLRDGQLPPEPEAAPASAPPVAQNVSVDVVPGQQTTVLKTADSTVTVIWLTPGVGQ